MYTYYIVMELTGSKAANILFNIQYSVHLSADRCSRRGPRLQLCISKTFDGVLAGYPTLIYHARRIVRTFAKCSFGLVSLGRIVIDSWTKTRCYDV